MLVPPPINSVPTLDINTCTVQKLPSSFQDTGSTLMLSCKTEQVTDDLELCKRIQEASNHWGRPVADAAASSSSASKSSEA